MPVARVGAMLASPTAGRQLLSSKVRLIAACRVLVNSSRTVTRTSLRRQSPPGGKPPTAAGTPP
jgi:hypothetical protein